MSGAGSENGGGGGGARRPDRPLSSSPTVPMVRTSFAQAVERIRETKPTVIVLAGPIMGARIALTGAPMIFGRSSECDVPIPDEGVSHKHLEIALGAEGNFVLRDLGSLNGTLVNGERMTSEGSHTLAPGDRVLIGHTPMRFLFYTPAEDDLLNDLELRSLQDPLTGLYNRRYLDQRLDQEVTFAIRHGTCLSLVLLDLDHFKAVNDGYGHPVGDRLLLELGSYLRGCVRTEDVVSRHGGEEFSLILRQIDAAGALTLAERLRSGVEAFPFVHEGNRIPVTVSIGVATVFGRKGLHRSELLDAADRELYRAKDEGRNRICSTTL
jgi:two-component system cell cycle response regulator